MVSGFLTSPKDHERIFSGEAMPMRMASKCSSGVNCLNRSSSDFIDSFLLFSWGDDRLGSEHEFLLRKNRGLTHKGSGALQLHVETQRTDFLDQDVERFRHAGL